MLFRNRRLAQVMACYLLLQTVTSLAFPSVSLAMMGPSQPEFTSYEAPGATDMVNLVTGDFSYSIPVLDVPGPERSFSLPLSYKAGIQLEQEASWVGLGWSLNPGAVSRTVNGYPDDDAGGSSFSRFNKEIESVDNSVVVPGIYTTTVSKYNGSGGTVDLLGLTGVNWDKDGLAGGDVVGIGYQKGSGFGVDPVRLMMAATTMASLGAGSMVAGKFSASKLAGQIGIGLIEGSATSFAAGVFGLGRLGGTTGYNNGIIDHTTGDWAENERRLFFLNSSSEVRYGSLYFGKMSQQINDGSVPNAGQGTSLNVTAGSSTWAPPQFKAARRCDNDNFGNQSTETAADIYQASDGAKNYYDARAYPVSIAHDYFNVMGEGATGAIRPYRLDVGSVAYPKIGTDNCYRHAKYMVVPFRNDYKVGFRYEDQLSNKYDYQQNGQDIGFQINPDKQSVTITDQRLFDQNARIERARKGLVNNGAGTQQLIQGKHTVWYSNAEIEQMTGTSPASYPDGFLDFEQPVAAAGTSNTFRHKLAPDGIGAFAVTVEDGTTYHYSLPVYQLGSHMEANERQLLTTVGALGKYTSDVTGYATTWLLTAITSPDFVDRNNSGTVDESDWGGWVKFTYGRFSPAYTWRQPYTGTSYSDSKEAIEYESYNQGGRENYYLNTISTRTHTALFVKSVREDGRGYPAVVQDNNGSHSELSSTLRLDEIILLDNATLRKLQTPDGIRAAGSSNTDAIPALTTNTKNNSTKGSDTSDDFTQVLDLQDFTVDSRIRQYVEANALKRVRFNYSYDLCRGTPNSFAYNSQNSSPSAFDIANSTSSKGGKLTLNSVSFFGPTLNQLTTKIIPDFVFGYDSPGQSLSDTNPGYSQEKWDAFGMYNPSGARSVSSHKPSDWAYPAPWTLTKITSPLGSTTSISYERDQYAYMSENGNSVLHFTSDGASTLTLVSDQASNSISDLSEVVKAGDKVRVVANLVSACPTNSYSPESVMVNDVLQIASVNSNSLRLTTSFNLPCGVRARRDNSQPLVDVSTPKNLTGGNIRVQSITTTEGSSAYKVIYKYGNEKGRNFNSTGVLTKAPPFLGNVNNIADKVFDYPATPVLYGKVTVLRGPFRNNDETLCNSREVYTFYTPTTNMVTESITEQTTTDFRDPFKNDFSGVANLFNNQVTINTGLIGRPNSIRTYNRQGQVELSSDFLYANQVANADGIAKQGYFSEGVLTNEVLGVTTAQIIRSERGGRVGGSVPNNPPTSVISHYQVNRTSKDYVPTVMVGSRNSHNNLASTTTNLLYDFYTGGVVETVFTNSLGKKYHSRTVPAYTLPGNEGMSAKGDNIPNKHMLAQPGAAYTFIEIPGGPAYNPLNPLNPATSRILSASVQTWQNNWTTYREPDAGGNYQNVAGQQPVWREAATYTWQAPVLEIDGSFKNFTPFNWTGASDSRWIKTGESVRYDHYSHAVEARDVNGNYAAQKTGYNQTQLIASASNARYTEVAYSGAEDPTTVAGATHFGGEVVAAGGTVVATPTHTGFYSLQLAGGQKGFVYRAQAGRDVSVGKTYRVSAWANANATSGKLYASLNGTRLSEASLTSATTKKAGTWYLLSLLVTLPATASGQTIEFGCANDGATAANFDDFRVAPLTSTMTSRVYDPRSNRLLYSLDNDNLFTRYEYTSAGRLKRIYQETLDGTRANATAERLVKEYEFNYARLQFPTWVTITYRCVLDGQGNYTGYEERQVVDINPLNNPPTPSKWESNGGSVSCTPPLCPFTDSSIPYRLRNNQWEQAQRSGQPVCQSCGMQNGQWMSSWVYYWVYSNGDDAGATASDCAPGDCTQLAPEY